MVRCAGVFGGNAAARACLTLSFEIFPHCCICRPKRRVLFLVGVFSNILRESVTDEEGGRERGRGKKRALHA